MKKGKSLDTIEKRWMGRVRGMILIITLVAVCFLLGCAETTVSVHRHLYKPVLPASMVDYYKGKSVDLNSFENVDQQTRKYYYYSPDGKVAYQAAVPLEYHVMDCFRDALWLAGMSVLKDSPDPRIPDMTLIIDHWTDTEFRFTVSILKNNALKFRNQYQVTMPPANMADAAQLEKNAYEMMNRAVLAVLSDPTIQELLK